MPPSVHMWPLLTTLLLRVHLSTCRLKVGNELQPHTYGLSNGGGGGGSVLMDMTHPYIHMDPWQLQPGHLTSQGSGKDTGSRAKMLRSAL